MNVKGLSLFFVTGLIGSLPAAAKLQMHVFQEDAKTSTSQPVQSGLKFHVFNTPNSGDQPQPVANTKTAKKEPILSYHFGDTYIKTGYRRDELYWNKAGRDNNPNILSELTWENIDVATLSAGTTLFLKENWFIKADFSIGYIFDGENQDSDYLGDNRTLEFSRSNNGADEGATYDISLATGYRWQPNSVVELRPLVGISYHAQNLKMVDGQQTLSVAPYQTYPVGPIPGLDSSYDSTWLSPWLGLDSIFTISDKFKIGLGFEYHYALYDATADWNLRGDRAHPESFTMEAKGSGLIGQIEGQYQITPKLSLNLDINYQDWSADKDGKQVIYWADDTTTKLKFNEVHWDSYSINFGVNLQL